MNYPTLAGNSVIQHSGPARGRWPTSIFNRAYFFLVALWLTSSAWASSTPSLSVVSVQATSVFLQWTDKSKSEANWIVERNNGGSTPFSVIATLGSNSTTYVDATVAPASTYRYRVAYVSTRGSKTYSSKGTVRTPALPITTDAPPLARVIAPQENSAVAGMITLTAEAADDVAVVKVAFFVDGNPVATVTKEPYGTPFDTSGLSDGSHSALVMSFDTANQSASARVTFRTDNSPPTVPAHLVAASSASQVSLTWDASSDVSGVSSYRVYRSGQLVGTVATAAFNDSGLADNLEYCYTVAAVDSLGNTSAASATACATTPSVLDLTAPAIPSGVAAVAPNCGQVNVSWNASSDAGSGVRSYWVFKNGGLWRQVFAPSTAVSDYNVAPLSAYSYAVAAVDVAGNQSLNSAATTVTTPACSEASGPTTPGALTVSASDCRTVNLSWAGSTAGSIGLRGYNVYRNNNLLRQLTATTTSDNTLAPSSVYNYSVAAVDNAGNESPRTAAVAVTTPMCADTTAPTVPGSLTASASDCRTATLNWSASTDTGGSDLRGYNIYRNNSLLKQVATTATADNTLSASSTYGYAITAVDNAGNESPRTATVNVTTPACADTTAPTAPGNLTVSVNDCGTASLTWGAATDAGGSGLRGYNVYRDGIYLKQVLAPATTAIDNTLSPNRTYGYLISAVDNAGNASAMSPGANAATPACADTAAPTVPGSVAATAPNCSRVDVSWTASSDAGSGVRGYRVYRNGQLIQEVLAPTVNWSDTSVVGASTYSYSVSAFDNAGNTSAASTGTTAFTPGCGQATTGQFLSVTTLGGADSDYGMAIAVDLVGNIFVGGSSAGTPFVAKLSPSKQLLWTLQFPNAGSVQSIAVDANGDVVLTGYFYATVDFGGGPLSSTGGYDVFIAKYSTDKRFLWAKRYGNSSRIGWPGDEAGMAIAVDASGNIAVAGAYYDSIDFGGGPLTSAGGQDGFVVKLDPNGTHIWSRSFGGGYDGDAAKAVAFDAQGNLVVGGRFYPNIDLGGGPLNTVGSFDAFLAKYSPSGAHMWSKRTGGGGYDTVLAMAVDRAGDVIVTGTFSASFDGVAGLSQGSDDVFLVKYDGSDGAPRWAKSFGSWNTDLGYSVATDAENNIVIAGRMGGPTDFGGGPIATSQDGANIYIAKYTPAGSHLWSKAIGSGREDARCLAVDSRGHSFVTGRFTFTQDFGGGPISNIGNSANPDIYVLELAP